MEHSTGLVYREHAPITGASSSNFLAAVKQGNLDSVTDTLQSMDGGTEALCACQGMWGSTPLIVACQYGHREIAMLLLSRSSVATAAHRNEKGASALLFACLEPGMAPVVCALVSLLVSDPTTTSDPTAWVAASPAAVYHPSLDRTLSLCPLSAVVLSNNADSVATVLDCYPVDAESTPRFDTPFGKGPLVVSGLGSKAASGRTAGAKGLTPIMLACAHGCVEALRTLLGHKTMQGVARTSLAGHFAEHRDELGCTALHHICRGAAGDENTLLVGLELLLAATASGEGGAERLATLVSAVDLEGNSVLHYVADSKYVQLAAHLLSLRADAGADGSSLLCAVNAQNINGATALYIAIKKRCEPLVSALLAAGADPALADRGGVSCIVLAQKLRTDSQIRKEVNAAVADSVAVAAADSVGDVPAPAQVAPGSSKDEEVSGAAAVEVASSTVLAASGSKSSLRLDGQLSIPVFQGGMATTPVPSAPSAKNSSFNRHGSRSRLQAQTNAVVASADDCLPSLSRKSSATGVPVPPALTDVSLSGAGGQLQVGAPLADPQISTTTDDGLVITDL